MVRPCDRGARAQQDQRIEQWKLHRVENFKTFWRPLHQRCSAFLTDQVGDCECMGFCVFDEFQRDREQGIIEPCPEPSDKEHDF